MGFYRLENYPGCPKHIPPMAGRQLAERALPLVAEALERLSADGGKVTDRLGCWYVNAILYQEQGIYSKLGYRHMSLTMYASARRRILRGDYTAQEAA